MNIEFWRGYINDMAWAVINKLESSSGSRFAAYSILIRSINNKDVDTLDKTQKGAYTACVLCGDVFWSTFKGQIVKCIKLDVEDDDLDYSDLRMLFRMLD